jgi:hypothetical protein
MVRAEKSEKSRRARKESNKMAISKNNINKKIKEFAPLEN